MTPSQVVEVVMVGVSVVAIFGLGALQWRTDHPGAGRKR